MSVITVLKSTDTLTDSMYTINTNFDNLEKLTENSSVGITSFAVSHNNSGQIDSVVTDKKTYTITYDLLNRLDTISDGTTTIQCQYNDYGQFTGTVTI